MEETHFDEVLIVDPSRVGKQAESDGPRHDDLHLASSRLRATEGDEGDVPTETVGLIEEGDIWVVFAELLFFMSKDGIAG